MDFRRYILTHDRKPSVSYVEGMRFGGFDADTITLPAGIKVHLRQKGKEKTDLEPRRDRKNPVKAVRAFGWGYNTPEAQQLAYTLLRQAGVSESRTKAAYVPFTEEVIALLKDWRWVIALQDVKRWVRDWEEEQAYLRQLEASRPKAIAPRSLPFYGVMEENLIAVAYDRVEAFLAIAPPDSEAHAAMLHLSLAVNLTEARRKTVNSIYWGHANAQARNSIWLQLLLLEGQIFFNVNQFGAWWDQYLDKLEGIAIDHPLPDSLSTKTAALIRYQDHKWGDLKASIHNLREFASKAQTRQEQYQPFLLKHQGTLNGSNVGAGRGSQRLVSATPGVNPIGTSDVGTGVQT